MQTIGHLCERARTWTSLRSDDELSELEGALLDGHLARCESCRAFAHGVAVTTRALRAAELERPELEVRLPRRRGSVRSLRVALGGAVVLAAALLGAVATPGQHARASKPVAMVAAADSPDALRRLRRDSLVEPVREIPRNRQIPGQSV